MSQRTKAIEAVTEHGVFDHPGQPLASIVQVGQSTVTKVWQGYARTLLTTADRFVISIYRPLPSRCAR
jgi:hypothetical protein